MINKIGLYKDSRKQRPWVVRWFGEYEPATGKQRRYSKSFVRKRDAEEFQSKMTMEFKEGQQRDKPEEITLRDFFRDWLKTKKAAVRAETFRLYEETMTRLYAYFGQNFKLSAVTPRAAATFIAESKPINAQNGEELSNWTRCKILRNCKTIFQGAVDWQLIGKNPFQRVNAPKVASSQWHYLKPKEYQKLLSVAPSLRWKAAYALGYTAGLRFGELFSLTWNSIDFETGEVKIENRSGTETMPPFYVKDYETRRVPLPKHTLDILTQLHSEAPEKIPYVLLNEKQYKTAAAKWLKYQKKKRAWKNQDMVNNIPREFKRHLKWAGIKPDGTLSMHTLRKSCIQNWADKLPIHVTKELAGHSDITTTQRYYLQVDDHHRAKAAEVIDSLLSEEQLEEKQTDARVTPRDNIEQNAERVQ